ncbi:hypothetical protein ABK040_007792 [Willaertia magna]
MEVFSFDKERRNIDLTPLGNDRIKFMNYGTSHVVVITTDDDIYVYGSSEYYIYTANALGLGSNKRVEKLVKVNGLLINGKIKFLECGMNYTLIVDDLNNFYITGHFGRLNYDTFTKLDITFKEKIKSIRCGNDHLFILTNNYLIYGFGKNEYGQLGLSKNIEYCNQFTKIDGFQVKDILCDNNFTMLLDNFGNVFVTGENSAGELGFEDFGSVYGFQKINFTQKVIKIFAVVQTSYLLTENNELFGSGTNEEGQLGVGDYNESKFEFTKIPFKNCNENITIHKSYGSLSCLSDSENNFYICGSCFGEYGIESPDDCLEFTKLDFDKKNYTYAYPILANDGFSILLSNFKVNKTIEEEEKHLGLNCFNNTLNRSNDIDFHFDVTHYDYLKKRNRSSYENSL